MRKLYLIIFIILFLPTQQIPNGPNILKEFSTCEALIKANLTPLGPVKVTMYHPVKEQTNENPDIVADNTRFDVTKATELEWIALSRDLHTRWGGPLAFNDIVYLEVSGNPGRFFKVKDIMNKRFTMRVDILETPGTPLYKFPLANLYKVQHPYFNSEELWAFYRGGVITTEKIVHFQVEF